MDIKPENVGDEAQYAPVSFKNIGELHKKAFGRKMTDVLEAGIMRISLHSILTVLIIFL